MKKKKTDKKSILNFVHLQCNGEQSLRSSYSSLDVGRDWTTNIFSKHSHSWNGRFWYHFLSCIRVRRQNCWLKTVLQSCYMWRFCKKKKENLILLWFYQVLAGVFREHHRRHHLLDMLTEVNKKVSAIPNERSEDHLSFQVPALSSTLRGKVFLS